MGCYRNGPHNILVCGYCKLGWLKEAAKVMELMTRDDMLPDVWTCNMLIWGSVTRVGLKKL